MVSRRKTIGALSKPCYGSCTPAARGATRLRNSDIGTGRSFASRSGARRASEIALRRRCLGEAEALIKDQPVEFVVADKGTTPTPPSRQSLHRTAKRLSRRAPIGLQPVHSLGTSTKAAI